MSINVTIIEDDKRFLECLKILLSGSKVIKIVETFCSGEKALEYFANNVTDVAVVDLGLPDTTGIELIKNIKMFSPEIDILVLTKFDDDEHIFPALKAGAVGYLLKDDPLPEIINAITEIYKGHAPMSGRIARRVLETFHIDHNSYGHKTNNLTTREKEVLKMLSKGFTPKEIGKELFISYECVRSHLKHIYKKLHAHSMKDAIVRAKEKGVIQNDF